MKTMTKMFAGGAAIAALAVAAPAGAQYAYPYNPYAQQYAHPYAYAQPYAYGYNNRAYMTQVATQRCAAAVQSRLHTRIGLTGIVSALLGAPQAQARVVSVTQVTPRRSTVRVRGLAASGRTAAYSPWGMGAYGAVGYGYQPDLSFKCDVDYRGQVRDIDINRRY